MMQSFAIVKLLSGGLVVLVSLVMIACNSNLRVQTAAIQSPGDPEVPESPVVEENGDPVPIDPTKFSMKECVNPDLTKVSTAVTLNLCDGTLAQGLMDLSNLKPEHIVQGVSIGSVAGILPLIAEDCKADGEIGCRTTAAFPGVDASLATAPHIRLNAQIAGIMGTLADTTPLCSANGEQGCLANSSYRAANFTNIVSGHIKNGVVIAGVTGTYPSFVTPLDNATADSDLTSFDASTPAGAYEFFDSAGMRYTGTIVDAGTITPGVSAQTFNGSVYRQFTVAGDAALTSANVKSGVTIFGVTGNVLAAPSECGANAEVGCVATPTFKAADLSALNPGHIKAGSVIAGVTGAYPSSTYPMPGATGTALPAFPATTAGTTYHWFKADGSVVTGTLQSQANVTPGVAAQTLNAGLYRSVTVEGDGDLVSGNIKDGTTIFDTSGNVVPASSAPPCSSDGEATCETNASFVAVDMTNALASNIKDGIQVAGVMGTLNGVPSDCSANNEVGCVATATYKAANFTGLVSGNVRDGVTLAGVTGTYPSLATPLAGATGTSDLTSLDAATPAGSYEFFGSTGTRYTGSISDAGTVTPGTSGQTFSASLYRGFTVAGDSDLVATNVRSGTNLFGVTGTMTPAPAACAADGATGCVATAIFKAANTGSFTGGDVKSGKTIALVAGTIPDCSADGGTACVVDGASYKAAKLSNFVAASVKSGVTIAGVVGTGTLESHVACVAEGVTGCVTTPSYVAADVSQLTPGNIKSGVTIAGVTGQFPSATYLLSGASGAADLQSGTFNSQVKSATAFEYWDAAGVRQTGAGDAGIVATNIASGSTIFGTAGSVTVESHSACAADGGTSCVPDGTAYKAAKLSNFTAADVKTGVTIAGVNGGATMESHTSCPSDGAGDCVVDGTTYKAALMSNATAANIKKGVTIAGVLGDYPSSSNKLVGADGTEDLVASTFSDQMKNATAFEWFDSKGTRHTGAGDADIKAGLILSGVGIFGTVGTYSMTSLKASALSATAAGDKITLNWTATGSTGVIVVRRAGSSVTWAPTNGTSYSQGSAPDANHTIVYNGALATYDDTGLSPGVYYYKAYPYNGDNAYARYSPEASATAAAVCGGAGDSCYDDAAAIAAGVAVTPSGKSLVYVTASGSFKVWKDSGSSKILRANGLDEWAMKLNLNGKGFMTAGNEFTSYTSVAGRVCPTHVYLSDADKFSTGNCIYYSNQLSAQALSAAGTSQSVAASIGLGAWDTPDSTARWYVGNIKTCADAGMRLPTIFETNTTSTNGIYDPDADGTPTFATTNGVPAHSSGYTWTATASRSAATSYNRWNSSGTASSGTNTSSFYVRCVLP